MSIFVIMRRNITDDNFSNVQSVIENLAGGMEEFLTDRKLSQLILNAGILATHSGDTYKKCMKSRDVHLP